MLRRDNLHALGCRETAPAAPGPAMTSFYTDLANWWPLLSPAVHYVEEVDDLLSRL